VTVGELRNRYGEGIRAGPDADGPDVAYRQRMDPFRVVIAGGGVAGLEALLALHELAGERIEPTLLAPEREFISRPLSVAEPFGLTKARSFDLSEISREHGARFRQGALARIDPEARKADTEAGATLEYDALLVAVGVRLVEVVPGSFCFRGPVDGPHFKALLEEIEQGRVSRLAFAMPRDAAWPLPLYELALLTAARFRNVESSLELHVVSPEVQPLSLFGGRASSSVRSLLEDAGVTLHLGQAPIAFEAGTLAFGEGARLECDRVISLPAPQGPELPGLPRVGPRRLVFTDRFGRVDGLEGVYAAGDITSFPIKQGGLAAQQADSAASAIAAAAGASVNPQPFRPILRGALITGHAPRFLRAQPDLGLGPESSVAARSVLWWPPAKVAGRLLAPYLARKAGYPGSGDKELADVEPPNGDEGTDLSADHQDVIELALSSANASARWRDYKVALRWLEVAEDLALYLPPGFEAKRIAWQELAGPDR
jgi:sulfide:quinone oxidoreductase